MNIKNLFILIGLSYSFSYSAFANEGNPLVCIHGMFGAPWNMKYVAQTFKDAGMQVTNWGYKSREKKIEGHAADLVQDLRQIAEQRPGCPIHFVTHSMGGLILRAAISHPDCPDEAKMGKAVLIAPPNQGAIWGRILERFSLAKKIAKKEAGLQLMTEKDFEHLGTFPPSMQVLVIAGNLNCNPFLKGDNDGTVVVSETYLTSAHEHVTIKAEHKSIVFNRKAIRLSKSFILK